MNGLIEETKDSLEEAADGAVRDAAIIAGAQAVEHYEISRYGTLLAWAGTLGHDEVAHLLQRTLEQEVAADRKLTEIAKQVTNAPAEGDGVADDVEAMNDNVDEDEAAMGADAQAPVDVAAEAAEEAAANSAHQSRGKGELAKGERPKGERANRRAKAA